MTRALWTHLIKDLPGAPSARLFSGARVGDHQAKDSIPTAP